jgi:hypothetical protein
MIAFLQHPDKTGRIQAICRNLIPPVEDFIERCRLDPSRSAPCGMMRQQKARTVSRRAQFQLWIFSYTIGAWSSRNRVSRVKGNVRRGYDHIVRAFPLDR